MAKGVYVSVNNIARKVKSEYSEVNGIARKVKKGYVEVNGVARKYFSSGITWEKYNISYALEEFTEQEVGPDDWGTHETPADFFYPSFSFSSEYGFSLEGDGVLYGLGSYATDGSPEDAIGLFTLYETNYYEGVCEQIVLEVVGLDDLYFYMEVVACATAPFYYEPYGSVLDVITTGSEDQVPEDGRLLAGSLDGEYCIARVNAQEFYYKKV